jgi:hypothetical protein
VLAAGADLGFHCSCKILEDLFSLGRAQVTVGDFSGCSLQWSMALVEQGACKTTRFADLTVRFVTHLRLRRTDLGGD